MERDINNSYGYKGPERREYKRIKRNFIAKFQVKSYEARAKIPLGWNMVTVQNVGAGGALFNFDKEIEPNELIDLKINFPASQEPISCVGQIDRIEKTSPSLFRIAVNFIKIADRDKELINRAAEDFYSKKAGQIEP